MQVQSEYISPPDHMVHNGSISRWRAEEKKRRECMADRCVEQRGTDRKRERVKGRESYASGIIVH